MSQTCYWQQIVPDKPLGSWQGLKYLLFAEGDRHRGTEAIIRNDERLAEYLRGYRDALPDNETGLAEGRKAALTEFLDHLAKHKELRVWIDE